MFQGKGGSLSQEGFDAAVAKLGIDAPTLWAIMIVETRGSGFQSDRRPKILFERHVFHRRTGGRHDGTAADLSNAEGGGYGEESEQHDRLERAMRLDRKAALESCSWGLGQVMGFNAQAAGFADVEDMVAQMVEDEDAQLVGMMRFIDHQGWAKHLRSRDWEEFAKRYNGPNQHENRYAKRLKDEHGNCAAGSLPDLRVRSAQLHLTYQGHAPGPVDGIIGTRTRNALQAFQMAEGLPATGALDDRTYQALTA